MIGFESRRVETAQGGVFVHKAGLGPPLLLLHSLGLWLEGPGLWALPPLFPGFCLLCAVPIHSP